MHPPIILTVCAPLMMANKTAEKFIVGLVQMACTPDPEANLEHAMGWVEEAARLGAQVISLPELFRSQYFCQREDAAFFDLAEPVPGPTTEALASLARKLGVVIVAPIFERRAAGLYHNSVVILDADGQNAGLYRKCTFRTIRRTTRNSISPLATLGSARLILAPAASGL